MRATYSTENERWQAVESRDRSAEGQFWLGVRTTGVFCRPGCPARTPLRKNVVFFDSLEQALRSGLRPCKRCKPLGDSFATEQANIVTQACRAILQADTPPSLEALAAKANMSPAHFQKLFHTIIGVTPAQFARSDRAQRLQAALPSAPSVLHAASEAGFGSSGQFYSSASGDLGMTPGSFRNRGAGERIQFTTVTTWLGTMLIAATERGICRLQFGENAQAMMEGLQLDFANATIVPSDADFEHLVQETVAAIGTEEATGLPVDIRGTAFQARVWHELRQIPFGETISYAELADRIGKPKAVRAVASACARNDIAVAVPCHRVVGKNGSLTGYRWGVERKQALLERESAPLPNEK